MSIVAIIPARGGSKRIPHKNIKPFCGKPMIAYSIEAAKNVGIFDRIIVSTDSEKIAFTAKEFGADVPFMRPCELADDYTGIDAVVLHALKRLMEEGEKIDYICCIYATAPFVKAEYIIKGYNILRDNNVASCFSVTTYPFSIFRSLKINSQNRLEMFWPEYRETRSQDLPEAYHDAGQFYWADAKNYLKEKQFYSKDAVPVILPRYLVQDIDTLEDWETAELMFRAQQLTRVEEPNRKKRPA
ncbi:MAG: pseudaminic acid cytidylyltransferase [Deltaproteobacteria bacterium]|nr:pseudaminic acid cytidylyltransferase [Deltaproteobacteria bacterium]